MTGGVSTQLYTRDIMNRDRFWQEELHQLNTEFLFSVRTSNYGGYGMTANSIDAPTGTPIIRTYEGHGQRLLLLRSVLNAHALGSCSHTAGVFNLKMKLSGRELGAIDRQSGITNG